MKTHALAPVSIKPKYTHFELITYCEVLLDVRKSAHRDAEKNEYDIHLTFHDKGECYYFGIEMESKFNITRPLISIGGHNSLALHLSRDIELMIQPYSGKAPRLIIILRNKIWGLNARQVVALNTLMPFFAPTNIGFISEKTFK